MSVGKNRERQELYLRNRKALVDYATPLVGSRADAEDIVQDAFLQFVPRAKSEELPPKSYLFSIVRNLSFNLRKRRKIEDGVASDDIPWWALPSSFASPEENVLFTERVNSVSEAVDALPEQVRRVLELYRFEGLTLQEIATDLGISIAKAHRLLNEAGRAIKEKMPREI